LISFEPAVEKRTSDRFVTFRFVLPAVREEDVTASVVGRRLVVSGMREDPTQLGEAEVKKLAYCAFEKNIELPDGLDIGAMERRLHEGVLDIKIPFEATKKVGLPTIPNRRASSISASRNSANLQTARTAVAAAATV
jgi:HSP20 family molecular chaperone IbpA